jgi:hypothetical protein
MPVAAVFNVALAVFYGVILWRFVVNFRRYRATHLAERAAARELIMKQAAALQWALFGLGNAAPPLLRKTREWQEACAVSGFQWEEPTEGSVAVLHAHLDAEPDETRH